MQQQIWRRWRHGPHTAIFQNSGGGGRGGGGGHIQGPGPDTPPPCSAGTVMASAPTDSGATPALVEQGCGVALNTRRRFWRYSAGWLLRRREMPLPRAPALAPRGGGAACKDRGARCIWPTCVSCSAIHHLVNAEKRETTNTTSWPCAAGKSHQRAGPEQPKARTATPKKSSRHR